MSGTYEMNGRTPGCWEDYYNKVNTVTYDRTMDTSYWMRPGVSQCSSLGVNTTCSFYGPKTVPKITQESFLQGRGQQLNSKCPDGDVIYLPAGVFQLGAQNHNANKCQTTELDPYFDRQPRSCFNISETDTTAYTMGIPGAWQGTNVQLTDFEGKSNVQGREIGRSQYDHPTTSSTAAQRGSYGNYNRR